MKEKFLIPEIEVVRFEIEDVITTSDIPGIAAISDELDAFVPNNDQ